MWVWVAYPWLGVDSEKYTKFYDTNVRALLDCVRLAVLINGPRWEHTHHVRTHIYNSECCTQPTNKWNKKTPSTAYELRKKITFGIASISFSFSLSTIFVLFFLFFRWAATLSSYCCCRWCRVVLQLFYRIHSLFIVLWTVSFTFFPITQIALMHRLLYTP